MQQKKLRSLFIIERKSDGVTMPNVRNHRSHQEVTDDLPPRLFISKGAAKSFLTTWCKGYQYIERQSWNMGEDSEESIPMFSNKGMRNIDEYQIKEIALIYV